MIDLLLNRHGNYKIVLLFCISFFTSCDSKKESVTVLSVNDAPLILCDESKVTDEKEIKLSELIEDFEIIHLENRDETFFKFQWMALSEHYICVWQSDGGAAKLFNKKGKFLCDVGAVGQGPGEYRSVYNILIDENGECIYISSLIGESILKYSLNGDFLREINLGESLNKPRLFLNPDSTISLVHLCFEDRDNRFVAANISTLNNDSIKYIYAKELVTNFKDKEGKRNGLNQEIWSYRNADCFPFMLTSTDTLYHYDSTRNEIKACFSLKMDPEKKGNSFFIFDELPYHFLALIVGENGKAILVNKETHEASTIKIVNDWMGNMGAIPRFQDGYYFDIKEPMALKEKIEKHITSGNCPEDQIDKLKLLMSTLNENDNNILTLARIKKQ